MLSHGKMAVAGYAVTLGVLGWPIGQPSIATKLYVATSMQRPATIATKAVVKTIVKLFVEFRKGESG